MLLRYHKCDVRCINQAESLSSTSLLVHCPLSTKNIESGHYGDVSTITIAPSMSAVTPVRCSSLTGVMLIRSAERLPMSGPNGAWLLVKKLIVGVYISSGLMRHY